GLRHHRYVDCCDAVCRVPPPELFPYRHTGERQFIDRSGNVSTTATDDDIQRERREARTEYIFKQAFLPSTVPARDLADHSPINYVSAVLGIPLAALFLRQFLVADVQ